MIEKINAEEKMAFMDVYTLSPVNDEIKRALNIMGCSRLNKAVPQNEVMKTQQAADILIHVEPLNKRVASFYRLSFSTKLVDYLYNASCILGLGLPTSTLSYIEENNAGIVIYALEKEKDILTSLFKNPRKIEEYGKNAWNCGVRNHKREVIRKMLIDDFNRIIKN